MTLIVIDMVDFDVILGMNLLAVNYACIDCHSGEVLFQPPSGDSFRFKGTKSQNIPKVISAVKAKRLMNQGAWGLLTSVVDVRYTNGDISTVPIVNEFLDVFPEELSGLPPRREVDFSIELEPGTRPISKTPYRIAPKELKELKEQLQELLKQGFIRPSVSPWGAQCCL